MSAFLVWLGLLLAFLPSCAGHAAAGEAHAEEGNHPERRFHTNGCRASGLNMGDMVRIVDGTLAGHEAKILNLQPAGNGHCHVLLAIPDGSTDILSILGIVEVEAVRLLRKVPE